MRPAGPSQGPGTRHRRYPMGEVILDLVASPSRNSRRAQRVAGLPPGKKVALAKGNYEIGPRGVRARLLQRRPCASDLSQRHYRRGLGSRSAALDRRDMVGTLMWQFKRREVSKSANRAYPSTDRQDRQRGKACRRIALARTTVLGR